MFPLEQEDIAPAADLPALVKYLNAVKSQSSPIAVKWLPGSAAVIALAALALAESGHSRPVHHTRSPTGRAPDVEGLALLPAPIEQALTGARTLAAKRLSDQFATLELPPGVEGARVDFRLKPQVLYRDGTLTLMAQVSSHTAGRFRSRGGALAGADLAELPGVRT